MPNLLHFGVFPSIATLLVVLGMCSVQEGGLYDYILCNDDLEAAFQQLRVIAQRALSGHTGNGTSVTPVTLVQDSSMQVWPTRTRLSHITVRRVAMMQCVVC